MPSISDCRSVLVVGATAGLGRSLAIAIRNLPSKPTVIAAGRRLDRLEELKKNDGIEVEQLDFGQPRESLVKSVDAILSRHPDIDAVILSAGIQRQVDFNKPDTVDLDSHFSELNLNFWAIVTTVTKCFIPHFQKLENRATFIMPISSGLAIRPGPWVPIYCATKAALHSYTFSLQSQLKGSNIHVVEIIPPLVESELHDYDGTTERLSKVWLPLDQWTKETVDELLVTDGSGFVATGMAKDWFDKYEKEKLKDIAQNPLGI